MPDNDKKRYLDFIAYLQVIGIILVVFGHSLHEFPDGQHGRSLWIYRYCYSFHMPLFLFISGFLMLYTTEAAGSRRSIPQFVSGKLKRLLLPMVVLTAVTFVPRSMMSFAADDVISFTVGNFFRAFIDYNYLPIPFFWYLHVSFILLCVCFLLINVFRRLGIPASVTMTAVFIILSVYALSSLPATYIFSINELKRLGLFFALGGIYGLAFDRVDLYIPWSSTWFFVLSILLSVGSFIVFEGTSLMYICAVFGIMMCISLAKIIDRRGNKFLDRLTGANFLIFLLSWYCNVLSQQVLAHFVELPWWIYSSLSLVAGIYIPWLAYKYLERHQHSRWIRFTSVLLGQSFRKK